MCRGTIYQDVQDVIQRLEARGVLGGCQACNYPSHKCACSSEILKYGEILINAHTIAV